MTTTCLIGVGEGVGLGVGDIVGVAVGVVVGVGVGGTAAALKVAMTPVHGTDAESTALYLCVPVALRTSVAACSPTALPLTFD
jgi:methionine aminopeptidase